MRYLPLFLLLVGCAGHFEKREAENLAAIESQCSKLGLQKGTPAFDGCKVRLFATYAGGKR